MKKLVRRMERLNTLIQMQAVALSAMAVILIVVFSLQMNFDHDNASSLITDQIPAKFHQRFFFLGLLLLAISVISFLASYHETRLLFTINQILCVSAITLLIAFAFSNQVSSTMILESMDG